MRICVTGATGFVGRAILDELSRTDHNIHTLVRYPNSNNAQSLARQFKLTLHPGTITDSDRLGNFLNNADAVIHLVGIISEVGPQTFESAHTQGTRAVVQAAQARGVTRFVHMSALGTQPDAPSRYHQTKWQAEQAVRHSDLDWTIFRPSIIYGAHDQFVNQFARMARYSPVIPVIGNGQNLFQPVSVKSVAKAFVRSLSEPRSVGQTYDLCGPDRLSFNQIIDHILTATHRKRLKLHLPIPMARLQANLLELLYRRILRRPSPLNRDQILMLREDNVGDPKPAQDLFSLYEPPFLEGISTYLKPSTGAAEAAR